MKTKIFSMISSLLLCSFLVTACDDDEKAPKDFVIEESIKGAVSFDGTNLLLDYSNKTSKMTITTYDDTDKWTARLPVSDMWIKHSKRPNSELWLFPEENNTGAVRETMLTILLGGVQKNINVYQDYLRYIAIPDAPKIDIDYQAGSYSFEVLMNVDIANVSVELYNPIGDYSWFTTDTFEYTDQATFKAKFEFTVTENPIEGENRAMTITFQTKSNTEGKGASNFITVLQHFKSN